MERGGLPEMDYTGGSAQKGFFFQADVYKRGGDFLSWSWKGYEQMHLMADSSTASN